MTEPAASTSTTSGTEEPPRQVPAIRFNQSNLSFGAGKRKRDGEVDGAGGDEEEEDDDDKGKPGRRKIEIEYIKDKSKRHITFSKRKAGIMKKAYELSTLTGTQVLLLVVSETGLVYTFTTQKLSPLVTDTAGKDLIATCLGTDPPEAGEEADEEDEEGVPMPPTLQLPEDHHEHMEMGDSPSDAQSPSPIPQDYRGHSQLMHQPSLSPYDTHAPLPPAPYANGTNGAHYSYDPSLMGTTMSMYPGMTSAMPPYASLAPTSLSTAAPNLAAASYVDPGHPATRGLGPPDRALKRRRTEGDLRSRSRSTEPLPPFPGAAPPVPSMPAMHVDPEAPLPHQSYPSRKATCEATAARMRSQAQLNPTLVNLVESFVWAGYAKDVPLFLPVTTHGDSPGPVDQHLRELLANAEHIFLLGSERGWSERKPLGTDELVNVVTWYAENLLTTMNHRTPFFRANSCDTLVDFLGHAHRLFEVEPPAPDRLKNLEMHFMEQHLAENPSPDLSNRKPAAKMKPRRGQNPAIREPRIRRMFTELGFWNIQKKDFLGNRKGRRMAGLFRVERIRRTFIICEPLELEDGTSGANLSYLKLRVPLAAPKILRRGDKLRLHIRCHDDGSEWNAVAYDGSELTPNHEDDEEDRLDEHAEYQRALKRGMPDLQAKSFARRQAGIKHILESGELPPDGFESTVPPKGGKQAFRVKPGTAIATATYGSQFEGQGEDAE